MSPHPSKPYSQLAEEIGHTFRAPELLTGALTHPSVNVIAGNCRTSNYERLEFLGDRVLGLVVAHLLYERFPDSREGGLATRFNALVRKETCALVGERIGLGDYLRLSPGEASAGGRRKEAILGNACEALIAAIYIDGGFEAARQFVERYWLELIDTVETPRKDPKTTLQEWAQGQGLPPPQYDIGGRTGPDHAPSFTIVVKVDDLPEASGTGRSKRAAEQEAAELFLKREGIVEP